MSITYGSYRFSRIEKAFVRNERPLLNSSQRIDLNPPDFSDSGSSESDGSISRAISRAGNLDDTAARLLWDRFFDRLCRYAQGKIYKRHRRFLDPEDIAGSAIFALMEGIKAGRFHSVTNRDQLWQMLIMIAARKAANKAKFFDREKRGGKRVLGNSALGSEGLEGLGAYIDKTDDPAKFVEIELTCRELLIALPDDNYREIALMRLAGFSNQEIGVKLECSTRTIDRKLVAIREVWNEMRLGDSTGGDSTGDLT